MPSSASASPRRSRKKHKRLDAIVDSPRPAAPADDPLRRSSRPRRPPVLLDSSPLLSPRKLKPASPPPDPRTGEWGARLRARGPNRRGASSPEPPPPVIRSGSKSPRSRRRKRARALLLFDDDADGKENTERVDSDSKSESGGRRMRALADVEMDAGGVFTPVAEMDDNAEAERDFDHAGGVGGAEEEAETEENTENAAVDRELEHVGGVGEAEEEEEEMNADMQADHIDTDNPGHVNGVPEEEQMNADMQVDIGIENVVCAAGAVNEAVKVGNEERPERHAKEVRRCGLCGGGTDGRPPKRLDEESMESDKEAYEGASASEELSYKYNMWDGFGDEQGWLGRFLGPLHDGFGIARVWVHQNCAVWSPEVYFAGLGCLKNIKAALSRGRALKCSRCGRSGATIGCRVDRCPKTYHLPCSRADGCIFDHRKFLIACYDHRVLFQPRGNENTRRIKKMKAKKLKLDMKKLSNDALRKDLDAEEKWLENFGEDEEFLKREGRRLHRDVLRIAPVYIGGSSETGELYQGWESVAGHKDVIQCMKEVVILPLLYPEFFSSLAITPPRGVLLHGYPGTGKTLVVRALIGACSRGDKRIAYFARKGADCLGKYVGDAERQLRLLFQVAERCQPSIIFFDEIDGLAPRRSRHQDQTHCSVVSTLLSLMDGLKSRGSVIVVGATNRPEAVDPALRRPGRFDREIYFPLPSEKERSAILSLHTQSWPNPVCGSLLSWIANQTVGYAGADLQSLCTQAAMNALKRNCAFQELMSSAEKGFGYGKRPSLPSFIVEERDWLEALAFSPPPCSRRDACSAANDIVSSPLQPHLVPCLLQPLSRLLILIYIDERIWLPPRLFRASESIKSVVISALEQKKVSIVSWWSHLPSLIKEPSLANEIERCLSCHDMIFSPSGFGHCYAEDESDDHEKFDSCNLRTSSAHFRSKAVQKSHLKCGKQLGFRSLISGPPRSGQTHLASCLLHGFRGHTEIHKVTLATISQEGHGDLIRGLSQILLKCLNVAPCVIYMPRIDLWSIDKTFEHDDAENTGVEATYDTSGTTEVPDARKIASEAWNSFVEQVDSACNSQSLIILATCEVQNTDLPVGIRNFFSSNVLDHAASASPEHSIPRFFIDIDGDFKQDQVLNSSAAKLSQDLVRQYVQLVHYRTHRSNYQEKNKPSHPVEAVSEPQRQNIEGRLSSKNLNTIVDSDRIASNSEASCRDSQAQHGLSSDHRCPILPNTGSIEEADTQLRNHQDRVPKVLPKGMKGGSMLAITTFGYQILRYPQFAELCWVTSKLTEGPSTDINGPWKRWPFNSCVTYRGSSLGKVVDGVVCTNLKDKEHTSLVRGLVAVGLLAYRGVYTSVREVSSEVRMVLELLVGQIQDKILCRKDRYHRYFQLLSQVAYLEDLVNSWAYTYQSLQNDSQSTASNSKPSVMGRLRADKTTNNSILVDNHTIVPPNIMCNDVQEVPHKGNSQKFVGHNGQWANLSNGFADIATLSSDANMLPQDNRFQESFPLSSLLSDSHPRSALAVLTDANGIKSTPGKVNVLDVPGKNSDGACVRDVDRSVVVPKSCSGEACHPVGLENNSAVVPEVQGCVGDFARNGDLSVISGTSCIYECCSKCLHTLYMLAHRTLSDCCRLNGHCSTLDDIHDIVASCSLNLLAAMGKYYPSQSNTKSAEFSGSKEHRVTESEHCSCQEVADKPHIQTSHQNIALHDGAFLPRECSWHTRNKEDTATLSSERNSSIVPPLSFYFRDGVLIPSDPQKDAVFHCRFEKLCTCFILQTMLMIKQPLD